MSGGKSERGIIVSTVGNAVPINTLQVTMYEGPEPETGE